jgi:hypothetical protein
LGGLYTALFFTVFFPIAVCGFLMRLLCNSLEGRNSLFPSWKNLGALFNEGILPMLIILAYMAPFLFSAIAEQLFLIFAGPSPTLFWTMALIKLIFLLLAFFFIPVAIIHFAIKGNLKDAFNFITILTYIKNNAVPYISTWFKALGITIIALIIGFVLLGIGLFFTSFAANVITLNMFAQVYRKSNPFADDSQGRLRASMVLPPPLS